MQIEVSKQINQLIASRTKTNKKTNITSSYYFQAPNTNETIYN
jgi:hypothetical protein